MLCKDTGSKQLVCISFVGKHPAVNRGTAGSTPVCIKMCLVRRKGIHRNLKVAKWYSGGLKPRVHGFESHSERCLVPGHKRKVRYPQHRVSVRVPPALPPTPTPAQDGNALKGMGTHLVKMRTANQLRMSALKAEDQGDLPAHLDKKTPTATQLLRHGPENRKTAS